MTKFRITVAPFGRSLSALRHRGDRSVDPKVLADELRQQPDAALPDDLRRWIADYLDGKIRPKRGRPPRPVHEQRYKKVMWLVAYQRYLDWLQAREKRAGHLKGWSCIREAGWWEGPPSEKAARMVAERLGPGYHAWRSVQTTISKKL